MPRCCRSVRGCALSSIGACTLGSDTCTALSAGLTSTATPTSMLISTEGPAAAAAANVNATAAATCSAAAMRLPGSMLTSPQFCLLLPRSASSSGTAPLERLRLRGAVLALAGATAGGRFAQRAARRDSPGAGAVVVSGGGAPAALRLAGGAPTGGSHAGMRLSCPAAPCAGARVLLELPDLRCPAAPCAPARVLLDPPTLGLPAAPCVAVRVLLGPPTTSPAAVACAVGILLG